MAESISQSWLKRFTDLNLCGNSEFFITHERLYWTESFQRRVAPDEVICGARAFETQSCAEVINYIEREACNIAAGRAEVSNIYVSYKFQDKEVIRSAVNYFIEHTHWIGKLNWVVTHTDETTIKADKNRKIVRESFYKVHVVTKLSEEGLEQLEREIGVVSGC